MNITKLICTLIVALTAIASASALVYNYVGSSSSLVPFTGSWSQSVVDPGYGYYGMAYDNGNYYAGFNARGRNSWSSGYASYGDQGYDSYGNTQYGWNEFSYSGNYVIGNRGAVLDSYYSSDYYPSYYGNYQYGSGQYVTY